MLHVSVVVSTEQSQVHILYMPGVGGGVKGKLVPPCVGRELQNELAFVLCCSGIATGALFH